MKYLFHLIVISQLLISVASFAQSTENPVSSNDCPNLKDPAAVTKFRDQFATDAPPINQAEEMSLSEAVEQALSKCFPKKIPACFDRVREEAQFHHPKGQYLDAKDDPRRQMPKELLLSGAEDMKYVFRPDLEEVAKKKGWLSVRYKSRNLGGFDPSPSLLMIEVLGSSFDPPLSYDRFINITLAEDDPKDTSNPVPSKHVSTPEELKAPNNKLPDHNTMVTVDRGKPGDPAKIFFQKFERKDEVFYPEKAYSRTTSCIACHNSGLRQISPIGYSVNQGEKQLPPDSWNRVKQINRDMDEAQNGRPIEFEGLKDQEIEPIVGPSQPLTHQVVTSADGKKKVIYPTRTKEFILGTTGKPGCASLEKDIRVSNRNKERNENGDGGDHFVFTSSPPVDWKKVVNAMDCESCHDGDQRGQLKRTGDFYETIDYKILGDQSMPHGMHRSPIDNGGPNQPSTDKLNPNERIALSNCLRKEFEMEKETKAKWLTEAKCDEAQQNIQDAKKIDDLLNQLRTKSCGPDGSTPASSAH